MIILAIDPGYDRMGLAVIQKESGSKETLLFSTCVTTSKKDEHSNRLKTIKEAIESAIQEYSPTHLAIETLFFSTNRKTAMKVAESRGVIIVTGATHSLIIKEYSPAQIKIAITGHGGSDKKQMMNMVPKLISMPEKKALDDEYDAIAVGLTCAAIER
jgi:crossover junction endodeoxyribonuclease RuvC